jgi:hypothetical protein
MEDHGKAMIPGFAGVSSGAGPAGRTSRAAR